MTTENELDGLLARTVRQIKELETTAFDKAAADRPLVLYGAGATGRKALALLRAHGIKPLAFCDGKADRAHLLEGVEVLPPKEAAARYGGSAAFVVTVWNREKHSRFETIEGNLSALGCKTVIPFPLLAWKYNCVLPFFHLDLPHRLLEHKENIKRAFRLFEDEFSRTLFLANIKARLLGDINALPPSAPEEAYVPRGLVSMGPDEIFIDGGAYDGDTIKLLLGRGASFKKIEAF